MDENAFVTAVFDGCDNGGGDLRLSSDEAGTTQLPLHVVSFDTSADTAVCWTLPTIDHDADTVIYIWGDNTGETQPAEGVAYGREAVYPAMFGAAYNFHDDVNDATSNDRDGSINDTPTYTSQKIGTGLSFRGNGNGDNVEISSNLGLAGATETIFIWGNIDSTSEQGGWFKVGDNNDGWATGVGEGLFNNQEGGFDGNENVALNDAVAWIDGNNNLGTGDMNLVWTLDSSGYINFWQDGVLVDGTYSSSSPNTPLSAHSYIGGHNITAVNDRFLNCDISLVWAITNEVSADWLATAYANQNAVGTFGTAAAASTSDVAAVVPVGMEVTIPAVTATWIAIVDAAVVPLVIEITPPAVTAVVGLAVEAAVVPVGMTLATTAVTATFVIELSAAVSPLVIELNVVSVSATYTSDFTLPGKASYDPLLDEVTYHVHSWHVSVEDQKSLSAGDGAADIGSNDAGTHFTGTTVEAILQELGQRVYDLENP